MRLNQKVSLYIQNEIIVAITWEIADKVVKVWTLENHDLSGTMDLCEVNHSSDDKGNIKNFIRKIIKEGKYQAKNPMHFDTIGFESVCHI